MTEEQRITEYVEKVFDMYKLSKDGLLYETPYFDEHYNLELIKLSVFKDGIIDDETITKISNKLGLTKEEILSTDMNAAKKYIVKYPFINLYNEFYKAKGLNSMYKMEGKTFNDILEAAIFVSDYDVKNNMRYDYDDIAKRLVKLLSEIDEYLPGTIHKNAQITNLEITTETCFSFKDCGKLLNSFFELVELIEKLFFKALKEELLEEERLEYNFLVNWLNITDFVMPSVLLTYENVRIYKEAYIKEGYNKFGDYAKIRKFIDEKPWSCKEFLDDINLVERYVEIFPEAKGEMREFAMRVKNFYCSFVWSDAQPPALITEEEQEDEMMREILESLMLGSDPCGDEDIGEPLKEVTHIYVKKNAEEIAGYEDYIEKITKVSSPSSKGGLVLKRTYNYNNGVQRIKERLNCGTGGAEL